VIEFANLLAERADHARPFGSRTHSNAGENQMCVKSDRPKGIDG
jgi:hypothetical protein